MKYAKGVTLIELMIVIVIIGVMAAVAVPAYSNYVRKANRADAHKVLERMAAAQARYNLNNGGVYTTVISSLNGGFGLTTDNGHYSLAIDSTDVVKNFTITATAIGGQLSDDAACQTLTIDHALDKTPIACW
jgi:type IV pilus assembly protein PilE